MVKCRRLTKTISSHDLIMMKKKKSSFLPPKHGKVDAIVGLLKTRIFNMFNAKSVLNGFMLSVLKRETWIKLTFAQIVMTNNQVFQVYDLNLCFRYSN